MSATLLNKPHFFKPLLPGFEDEFLIPAAYSKYLNGGKECEKAMLGSRKGGNLWPVKINGRRFEDGWKQFVVDHDLRIGDFLVFRHEGDLVFYVLVFDRTTCEREYASITARDCSSGKKLEEKNEVKTSLEAKASSSVLECPYSVIQLTPNSIKKSRLLVPRKFAREQGLSGRCCSMMLMDGEGNCWSAKLLYKSSSGKTYIAGGWASFRVAHKLQTGDSLIVELTRNGKIPVLKMRRLQEHPEVTITYQNNAQASSSLPRHLYAKANSEYSELRKSLPKTPEVAKESGSLKSEKYKQPETASEAKASSSSVTQKSFFVVNVPFGYKRSKLYIPAKFSRLHFENKKCCKVILLDQEGRSWPAYTWHRSLVEEAYIADGWKEFSVANKLKSGDSFVFELIENGERPIILKMHGFKTNHKAEKDQEAASSSLEKPYIYVTLQVNHIRNSQMRIPTIFSRRCGFATNKCSAVTIRNEMGNSWIVSLKVNEHDEAYMTFGFVEFFKENGIEEGDVFMLELVKEGFRPELKYCALKQEMDSNNQKWTWEEFENVKPII